MNSSSFYRPARASPGRGLIECFFSCGSLHSRPTSPTDEAWHQSHSSRRNYADTKSRSRASPFVESWSWLAYGKPRAVGDKYRLAGITPKSHRGKTRWSEWLWKRAAAIKEWTFFTCKILMKNDAAGMCWPTVVSHGSLRRMTHTWSTHVHTPAKILRVMILY